MANLEEINQMLLQFRKVTHQAIGETGGIMGDTMTSILTAVGQKMAQMEQQIEALKKENEELKQKKK
jgi:hypothetical protein